LIQFQLPAPFFNINNERIDELFLQEWNEACVYARECILPPYVYENSDPFYVFLTLFGTIYAIYLINESKIKKTI